MRLTLKITINLLLCLLPCALFSSESAETYSISITQKTRHDALIELASQTGYEILFGVDSAGQENSLAQEPVNSLHGDHSIVEALEILLDKSDYGYSFEDRQIRIVAIAEKAALLPKITVLGYLRDSGARVSQDQDSQESFPLYQVPLSIQSISRQHIEDVQALDVGDIISYIGGVEYFERAGGVNPQYYSRGILTLYSIDGKFYRRTTIELDPAVLDRVDVIQGPSANYFFPGGMLNFVTKKPRRESQYEFSLVKGSEDYYRSEIDINFAAKNINKQALRFIAVSESQKSVKDFGFKEKYVMAPSLELEFSKQTRMLLSAYHQVERRYPNSFTFHRALLPERLPREQTLGTSWAETKTRDSTFAADISNSDWKGWRISAGANWNYEIIDHSVTGLIPIPIFDVETSQFVFNTQGDTYLQYLYQKDNVVKTRGLDLSAEKGITLFGRASLFRVGVDYQHFYNDSPVYHSPIFPFDSNFIIPFNVSQTDYYAVVKPNAPPKIGGFNQLTEFYGINITQTFHLSDIFTLHSDLRYEEMGFKALTTNDFGVDLKITGDYKEFTPRFGLNISMSDTLSSHLSYTESFTHQAVPKAENIASDMIIDTDFVDPMKNSQVELAFKKSWLDGDVFSSLTLYKLTRSNTLTLSDVSGSYENILADDQISKGACLSVNGRVSKNLNVIVNTSYNDNNLSVVQGPSAGALMLTEPASDTDNRLHGTAKSISNLWLNYRISKGGGKGFEFGLGIKYVGERYADDGNTYAYRLPAYTKSDVVIKYKGFSGLTLSMTVRNVFDRYYYKNSLSTPFFIEEGDPRSIFLRLKSTGGF